MKSLRSIALLFLAGFAVAPLHAETTLPASGDSKGWQSLIEQFAECSAVYNLAATVKESPEKGPAPYRELANNALIAGMYSTERAGMPDNSLETIYTKKYNNWEAALSDKSNHNKLLLKADQCITTVLPMQNEVIITLRDRAPGK